MKNENNLAMVLDSAVYTLVWALQVFQRTNHGSDMSLHDVSISFGGFHIGMPHELLDDTNVCPAFEQMGCEIMAQGVAADPYRCT